MSPSFNSSCLCKEIKCFSCWLKSSVDPSACVICGVKLWRSEGENKHLYNPEHCEQAHFTPLYLIERQTQRKRLSVKLRQRTSWIKDDLFNQGLFYSPKCLRHMEYWFRPNKMMIMTPCASVWLCVFAFLLMFLCWPEFAALPLKIDGSHQTLMNVTLCLLLGWFASLSWHWISLSEPCRVT